MVASRSQRFNIALALLFCILVSGFACGHNFAPHPALNAMSVEMQLCAGGGSFLVSLSDSSSHSPGHADSLSLSCPLCQTLFVALVFFVVGFLRKTLRLSQPRPYRITWASFQAWPPANPRAP